MPVLALKGTTGTDASLNTGSAAAPAYSRPHTFACWVNFAGTTATWGGLYILYDGTAGFGDSLAMYGNGAGDQLAYMKTGNTTSMDIAGPVLTTGLWYFVAIVYGTAITTLYWKRYGGAMQQASCASSANFTPVDINIGDQHGGSFRFNGSISGCKIWQRSLNAYEVERESEQIEPANPGGLWGFYPFDYAVSKPVYRTSAAGGGTSGTGSRTAAITTAVGDLLCVFASYSGTTDFGTVTDNQGGTYDTIGTAAFSASANVGGLFVRKALATSAVSTTVTVPSSSGSNTAGEIVVVAYSNMILTGAAAVRQFASQANQAASTTPAPAFGASAFTYNPTLGAIFNATSPATMTAPSGWTERQDVGQSTPSTGLEVVTRDSGFTGTTVTWGGTSGSVFASMIVELNATRIRNRQGYGLSSASSLAPVTAGAYSLVTGPPIPFYVQRRPRRHSVPTTTAYSKSISESIGAPSDAVTRAFVGARTLNEAIAVATDAATRSQVLARGIGESVGAPTDAAARVAAFFRSPAENVSAPSDAVARALVESRSVPENVSAPTDAATRAFVGSRSTTETIGAPTDAVTEVKGFPRSISENITASTDAVVRSQVFSRSIAESITKASDAVARVFAGSRSIAESIGAPSDAVAATKGFTRSIAESITSPSDAVTRALTGLRSIAESITKPSDAVTRVVAFSRSIAESIGVPTDALARVFIGFRNIGENVGAPTDTVTGSHSGSTAYTQSVSENISVPSDAVARVFVGSRPIAESITKPTDAVSRLVAFPRAIGETITAPSDNAVRATNVSRNITEDVSIPTDTPSLTTQAERSVVENVGAPTDAVDNVPSFTRSISESIVAVLDALVRGTTFARDLAESILATTDSVVGQYIPAFIPLDAETSLTILETRATAVILADENAEPRILTDDMATVKIDVSGYATLIIPRGN